MKKTGILLFHPNFNQSNVNRHLASEATNHGIEVRREYDLYPGGKIDVEAEHQFLLKYDRIVLQFPMYWYSSPSLLKKWEDQVLTYGWAYGSSGNQLKNKELLIAVSPGATGYSHDGQMHYTVHELLRPFQATSNLIGTKFTKPFITEGASSISDDDLKRQAVKYVQYLEKDQLPILGMNE
ncbi:general stress protein 14 [Philodulcilactobacillus myokoensis]|uniref:General stress protein 14 n=1 Tax=Philodulcilactobacillus myokoensis TaxID=2929573 RepID=A0A9W6B032_9LACO|nr:NAD(P)H-dependent oxidoreductase [Philodulcilactobacillus myokoensis]GLB46141.1 general stress protein 14 [Philodulcilactobacillus myokoensis]